MKRNKVLSVISGISGISGIIIGGLLIFNPDNFSKTAMIIIGVLFLIKGVDELAPILWEKIQ